MKTLILIRHAKSSWDDASVTDHDRPLNERGIHDAPMMAKRLLENHIPLQACYTSTALRAKSTALFFAEAFGLQKQSISELPELYLAGVDSFKQAVNNISDNNESVALFAHNPGITHFANSLADVRLDDMPTCSVFAVKCAVNEWKEFNEAVKQFYCFSFPKKDKMIWGVSQ